MSSSLYCMSYGVPFTSDLSKPITNRDLEHHTSRLLFHASCPKKSQTIFLLQCFHDNLSLNHLRTWLFWCWAPFPNSLLAWLIAAVTGFQWWSRTITTMIPAALFFSVKIAPSKFTLKFPSSAGLHHQPLA